MSTMNRRSFFKSALVALGLGAVTVVPQEQPMTRADMLNGLTEPVTFSPDGAPMFRVDDMWYRRNDNDDAWYCSDDGGETWWSLIIEDQMVDAYMRRRQWERAHTMTVVDFERGIERALRRRDRI